MGWVILAVIVAFSGAVFLSNADPSLPALPTALLYGGSVMALIGGPVWGFVALILMMTERQHRTGLRREKLQLFLVMTVLLAYGIASAFLD